MELSVIKIGNSKGVRLPKSIIDKYAINETVEVVLKKDSIVLKPVNEPRKGWEKAFKEMRMNGEDKLLIRDVFEDENIEE